MGLKEQQDFMARLFADERLRLSFLESPEDSGLTLEDLGSLKGLLPKELNFFAESLVQKRLQEVEKMMPLTVEALGKRKFREAFKRFAQCQQPGGVKKHLADTLGFSEHLLSGSFEKPWQKDVVKFEQARLFFFGHERKFVFRVTRYDFLSASSPEKLRKQPFKRLSFRLWMRFGKRVRHFAW